MKITVHTTEHCVAVRLGKASTFYLTKAEFHSLHAGNCFGCFDDCGNILQVRSDYVAFVRSAGYGAEEGTVEYVRAKMDSAKFWNRVDDLIERGFIGGDDFKFDSESFAFEPGEYPKLTFSQILKHPAFNAVVKLKEAVKLANAYQLSKLRDHVSRLLDQGKGIVCDGATASFYFYQADGKGYNGGIIWHGDEDGWSVHT